MSCLWILTFAKSIHARVTRRNSKYEALWRVSISHNPDKLESFDPCQST